MHPVGARPEVIPAVIPAPALLDRTELAADVLPAAVRLLGCTLEADTPDGTVAVRLVEVEAYRGADDPASHSYRGPTPRNAVMFGPAGHLYVYFVYGMHFCANVSCLDDGEAGAVLLRAGEVVSDLGVARRRRPTARRDEELARGPARLRPCLGLDRSHNGVDVTDPASPVRLLAGPRSPPARSAAGPRVGVAAAHDRAVALLDRRLARGQPLPSRRAAPSRCPVPALRHPATRPESGWPGGGGSGRGHDILDELEWRGLIAQSTDRARCSATSPRECSPSTAASTPPRPACTPATWSRCSPCAASSRPGPGRSCWPAGPPGMIGDPARHRRAHAQHRGRWPTGGAGSVGSWSGSSSSTSSSTGALVVNNLEWTGRQSMLEFLRDVGKHFSVNVMLGRETVKRRLAADGMSYTEFSYLLLQSQDYLHLYRTHGCRLQIGGSDQWGNIVGGVELVRRVDGAHRARAHHAAGHRQRGPQVRQVDGRRQHLARPGDDLAVRLVPVLRQRGRRRRGPVPAAVHVPDARRRSRSWRRPSRNVRSERAGQRRLAAELTTLVHGRHQTEQVIAASTALFGRGDLRELDAGTLDAALAEVPTATASARRPARRSWTSCVATGLVREPRGRAAGRERGRGVREQRQGARRAVDRGGGRPAARRLAGGAPRQAHTWPGRG